MVNSFLPFGRIYRMDSASEADHRSIPDSYQGLTHHDGGDFGA